uniref:Uncharacterized protein n=1 Tax=Prymnesium polylepis TaxID=72548 RepID=A0A7S4JJH6_9EUKA
MSTPARSGLLDAGFPLRTGWVLCESRHAKCRGLGSVANLRTCKRVCTVVLACPSAQRQSQHTSPTHAWPEQTTALVAKDRFVVVRARPPHVVSCIATHDDFA